MSDFTHAMKFAVPISVFFIAVFEIVRVTVSIYAAALFGYIFLWAIIAIGLLFIIGDVRNWYLVDQAWGVLES